MADNRDLYGFRWSQSANGQACPKTRPVRLASAYQGAVNGGGNIDIRVGDPVTHLGGGYYAIAEGSEESGGDGDPVGGIVIAVGGYKGANNTRGHWGPSDYIPGGTTYTDVQREASIIHIVEPHRGMFFEIDCDDAVTATTYAAYLALIGENCDHVLDVAGTGAGSKKANAKLDISGHATTALQWRIVGISETEENADFSGANVKLLVEINEGQIAGNPSTTGV